MSADSCRTASLSGDMQRVPASHSRERPDCNPDNPIVAPPPAITLFDPTAAALQCIAGRRTSSGTDPVTGTHYSETILTSCGRRWTMRRASLRQEQELISSHRRLQLSASFLAGYILSAKKIPSTPQAPSTSPSNSEQALSISSPNPAPSAWNIKISTSQTHTLLLPIPVSITDSSN
jgi:hypothetical protein